MLPKRKPLISWQQARGVPTERAGRVPVTAAPYAFWGHQAPVVSPGAVRGEKLAESPARGLQSVDAARVAHLTAIAPMVRSRSRVPPLRNRGRAARLTGSSS
jgi:hypothetical protein